jgi:hypothetical protein
VRRVALELRKGRQGWCIKASRFSNELAAPQSAAADFYNKIGPKADLVLKQLLNWNCGVVLPVFQSRGVL